MRKIKDILKLAVVLLWFVIAVMVLLKSYKLFIKGYQLLGNGIEHPSIESLKEDWKGDAVE